MSWIKDSLPIVVEEHPGIKRAFKIILYVTALFPIYKLFIFVYGRNGTFSGVLFGIISVILFILAELFAVFTIGVITHILGGFKKQYDAPFPAGDVQVKQRHFEGQKSE